MRGKKLEITVFSVFLAMLVVFIHICSFPLTLADKDSLAYALIFVPWRLSAFVVQGFVFLSAMKLFMKKDLKPLGLYYKERFFKILPPYAAAFLIFYIYFLVNNYFSFDPAAMAKQFFIGNLVSHFYFIIIILQFYLLRPLWEKLLTRNPFCLIPVSFLITVLSAQYFNEILSFFIPGASFAYADRLFTTYLFFWICGAYAGLTYESFKSLIKKYGRYITLLFLALAGFNSYLALLRFKLGVSFSLLEPLHALYAIFAILFFMLAATRISGLKAASCRLLRLLGNSAFEIYLIHPLFIFILKDYVLTRLNLSPSGIFLVSLAAAYPAVVIFGISVGLIKEKSAEQNI